MQPPLAIAALPSRLIATLTICLVFISMARASAAQLTVTPDPLTFARVAVNHTLTLQVHLKNSGSSSVIVSSMTNNAPAFTLSNLKLPLTLPAGETRTFSVTFAPTITGSSHGNITFQSNASNDLLILKVRGLGFLPWMLHANPPSLNFGSIPVGKSFILPIALTNSSSSGITVSQASIAPAGFSFSGLPLPLIIAAGHSFTFSVKFTARAMGAAAGSLLVSNPSVPILKIPLAGAGSANLTVAPGATNFGKVVEGTGFNQTGTVSALGASVTISSASISNPLFVLSGLQFPVTVPAGQNVPFMVTFFPVAKGPVSGVLSFVSDATDSPTKESLTGVGIPPYSVHLSWTASTSDVTGYNVYRRESQSKYRKLNSALVVGTTFTDGGVIAGNTYYYETTAVNSTGQESTPSNQATAVVP
jgi:hypothetical protein